MLLALAERCDGVNSLRSFGVYVAGVICPTTGTTRRVVIYLVIKGRWQFLDQHELA